MPIRLSGINSGLDTDAIVKELVSAYSLKSEKYEKQKTKLEWKQDAWKGLNTKIYSFYTNVSSMRMSGSYSLKKTTVSDISKATVTAGSDAVTGTQKLNILQTAQSSYITGGYIGANVTATTTMKDLGYTGGKTSFKIEGKDGKDTLIEVTADTKINDVINKIADAGLNASFDTNNKRIFISAKESGAANDFNLVADSKEGNDILAALGLTTAFLNEKGEFVNGAQKYQSAYNTYLEAQAAGGLSVADYINKQLEDYKANNKTIQDYAKLQQQLEARNAHNEIYAALNKSGLTSRKADEDSEYKGITSTQLKELTKAVYADGKLTEEEVKKYIEDNGIECVEGTSATDIYNVLKDQTENMAKSAEYSKKYDDLIRYSPAQLEEQLANAKEAYETAVKENAENKYAYLLSENGNAEKLQNAIQQISNDAARAVEIKADSEKYSQGAAYNITGQDAIIKINGVEFTNATNTFKINGLTIEATGVTGDGEENAITINTTADTQAIYDKIKDFLTEYNNLINEITKLYNAESAKDYEPLTDEEREAMSDEQIEKWEGKIKSALLRRDNNLGNIMSAMINSMAQTYEVDGQKVSLSTFGISTLGFLNAAENEQNAFHIDGDEEDENTSGKKDKLMAAIQENPDQVMNFMKQLASNLYSSIDQKMKSTELSSAYKVYNDKELDREMTEIEKMIAKWEEKIADQEDAYFKKFSQMEVALSKLQSQTNSLSGLLG